MKDDRIQLTQTEIDELKCLEKELTEIKNKIRSYKDSVIRSHGCKDTIGIMSYKVVLRNYLCEIKDEKFYTILAWRHQWHVAGVDYIRPRYSHVTLDGGKGKEIELIRKHDVEFVPLDDCTFEEAMRILKDVKKKKKSDNETIC